LDARINLPCSFQLKMNVHEGTSYQKGIPLGNHGDFPTMKKKHQSTHHQHHTADWVKHTLTSIIIRSHYHLPLCCLVYHGVHHPLG
jgi:hypothetical protein